MLQEWRNRDVIHELSNEQKLQQLIDAYEAVDRFDMKDIITDIVTTEQTHVTSSFEYKDVTRVV